MSVLGFLAKVGPISTSFLLELLDASLQSKTKLFFGRGRRMDKHMTVYHSAQDTAVVEIN